MVGQQFYIGFYTHFRCEIAMQFHILGSNRNTLQITVEERTETEFFWSIRNDRSMAYIRCSSWFRTIQGISHNRRWIRRSHLQLSIFVDHLWRFYTERDAHGIQTVIMFVYHSAIKVSIIFLFLGTPTNFCQCTQTRENLILCKTRRKLHQLCPKTSLYTNQQLFFFRRELQVLIRLVTIHSIEWNDGCPTMSSFCRSILHVEIQVFTRLHHCRLTFLDGLQALLLASPCHHSRARTQATMILNIVPPHHHLTMLHDDVFHSTHEMSMKFFHILVAFFLHQCVTFRTLPPIIEHHFISTDVDVRRREEVC